MAPDGLGARNMASYIKDRSCCGFFLLFTACLGVVGASASANTVESPYQGTMLANVQRHTISSDFAKVDYEIFVSKPMRYEDTEQSYPVLVVLDAPYLIGSVVEAARLQAIVGEAREIIVVGVGAGSWFAQGPRRMRDFSFPKEQGWYERAAKAGDPEATMLLRFAESQGIKPEIAFGGAEPFFEFLKSELLPYLDSSLRIDMSDIGIFGHSAAGGFLNYVMLYKPKPFTKLIIGSATSNIFEENLEEKLSAFSAQERSTPTLVLSGFGGSELNGSGPLGRMLRTSMETHKLMMSRAPSKVTVVTMIFPGENHSSVISSIVGAGIRIMWGTGRSSVGEVAEVASPSN